MCEFLQSINAGVCDTCKLRRITSSCIHIHNLTLISFWYIFLTPYISRSISNHMCGGGACSCLYVKVFDKLHPHECATRKFMSCRVWTIESIALTHSHTHKHNHVSCRHIKWCCMCVCVGGCVCQWIYVWWSGANCICSSRTNNEWIRGQWSVCCGYWWKAEGHNLSHLHPN